MRKKPRTLMVGQDPRTILGAPSLLHRAGFWVDMLLTTPQWKNSRFVAHYEHALDIHDLLEKLSSIDLDAYDYIIVGDDPTLKAIAESALSLEKKLKILPVQSEKNFSHLFSKIGLSELLQQSNITTPPFAVANNISEARHHAESLGYPILVKVDASFGGGGVFECNNREDFTRINEKIFTQPVLIQKKIDGTELDLSAIYGDGKLIHFSYSTILDRTNAFGISVVRLYKQLHAVEKDVFVELQRLGEALGADGFVTISCIESTADKKRYFIEADMRPNSWMDFGKFYGDDAAVKLSEWFRNKKVATYPFPANTNYPQEIRLAHYDRMPIKGVLLNRHNVLKYAPFNDIGLLLAVLYPKFSEGVRNRLRRIKHLCHGL